MELKDLLVLRFVFKKEKKNNEVAKRMGFKTFLLNETCNSIWKTVAAIFFFFVVRNRDLS